MKGNVFPYVLGAIGLLALAFMRGDTSTSIGDAIADEAEKRVGMGATADAQAFGDYLGGPGETDNMKQSMASAPQSSTCGLAVRAEWRETGLIDDPYLQAPYLPRIGMVITDLIAFAQQKGAWIIADPSKLPPKRGAMVAVGPAGNITHVYTVTGVTANDDGTYTITSVDGGMTDQYGKQMIGKHIRTWTVQGGQIVDAPDMSIARVVYGWTDPDNLA